MQYLLMRTVGLLVLKNSGLVVLLSVGLLSSPSLTGTKEAAALYLKGAYTQAYQVYQECDPKTAELWYNMGNCAYKSGNMQAALICWERAFKGGRSDVRTNAYDNIRFATKKAGISYDIDHNWFESVPLVVWQLIVVVMWYTLFWSAFAWRKRYTILLLVVNCVLGYSVVRAYQQERCTPARVIVPKAPLFVAPNNQAHICAELTYLTPLTLIGTKDSWYKVCYCDSKGWIAMEHIAVV